MEVIYTAVRPGGYGEVAQRRDSERLAGEGDETVPTWETCN